MQAKIHKWPMDQTSPILLYSITYLKKTAIIKPVILSSWAK